MRRNGSLLLTVALSACARPNSAYDPAGGDGGATSGVGTTDGLSTGSTAATVGASASSGVGTGAEATTDPAGTVGPSESGGPITCPAISDDDCDITNPDDCEEGSRCRPWSDGDYEGIACVKDEPVVQTLAVGDPCEHRCGLRYGVDDCPDGSICDPFADVTPTCVELCVTMEMCTDGQCVESGGYGLCRAPPANCDILLQDCPDGQACYPGIRECTDAGPLPAGAPCTIADECQAGHACADGVGVDANCDGDAVSCCVALCDVEDPTACGAGQTCIAWPDGYHICVP